MSRGLGKISAFGLLARAAACLLLLSVSPQLLADLAKLRCQKVFIEDSYKQMDFATVDLAQLQVQLKKDGYFKSRANGKWGKRTIGALNKFCRDIKPAESIPELKPRNPTPALFQFLLAQASKIEPAQVCVLDEIEASFKKLPAGEQDKTLPKIRQVLKADGFMNADSSGKMDDKTLEGLEKFCIKLSHKGKVAPREDTKAATDKLAMFLINELIDASPEKEDEGGGLPAPVVADAPKDCGVEAVKARFNGLGVARTREIQQFLKAGGYLTDWADGVAGPETYLALSRVCRFIENTGGFDEKDTDKPVIDELASRLKNQPPHDMTADLEQRVGEIALVAADSEIEPPAAGCGCSRDFAARVYGFLPYWLADGEKHGADFSMLDRVGIFGLQLDSLLDTPAGQSTSFWRLSSEEDAAREKDPESHIARFINTAKRYRVKVDVTFYTRQWRDWDIDSEQEKIVDTIENAYRLKFSDNSDNDDFVANLISLLRKILPFIDRNTNVGADGINLYFDHFTRIADAEKIIAIVKAVHKRMPEVQLNLMLDPNWSGIRRAATEGPGVRLAGIHAGLFASLEDILKEDGEITNLLVFLPRNTLHAEKNTSHAKKLLRRTIEDAFDGKAEIRRSALRKTVPILITLEDADESSQMTTYYTDGDGFSQFGDDLTYLQDNFDGVGLWPLPLVATPPEENGEMTKEGDTQEGDTQEGDTQEGDTEEGDTEEADTEEADTEEADKKEVLVNDGAAIAKVLVARYQVTSDWLDDDGPLAGDDWKAIRDLAKDLADEATGLCEFACPNRWLFRLLFDFLVGVLVIYGGSAYFNCRLREIYQQNSQYFVGYGFITAMVACVSLICDPFWQEYSEEVLIGVILALVGYLMRRRFQQSKQANYP